MSPDSTINSFGPRLITLAALMVAIPVFLEIMSIETFPTYQVFLAVVVSLTLTLVATPAWITFLRGREVGQQIRVDGPAAHLAKTGTPTMGGLLILATAVFAYLVMAKPWNSPEDHALGLLAVGATLAAGLLGFLDDFSKIRKARSLGLKARSKLLFQLAISAAVGYAAYQVIGPELTLVNIPLIETQVDFGFMYFLLVFVIVVGTSNAVNLTDGLDGLAAGTVMIVMLSFGAIAFRLGSLDLALFSTAIAGACIGFLWYNSYPANIFMGDTGSLALGTAVAVMAILTKTELLLVLIGGIFVIEALSVIIQVGWFRMFGKRPFKMAPIHHHFELLGWSETTIMVRFWIVTAVLAGLGFSLFFISTIGGLPV